jgi:hypothetical protein
VNRTARLIAAIILAALMTLTVVACGSETAEEPAPPATEVPSPPVPDSDPAMPPAAEEPAEPSAIAWLDTELVDVATGEAFRISDFKGRPVLVKTFAVW